MKTSKIVLPQGLVILSDWDGTQVSGSKPKGGSMIYNFKRQLVMKPTESKLKNWAKVKFTKSKFANAEYINGAGFFSHRQMIKGNPVSIVTATPANAFNNYRESESINTVAPIDQTFDYITTGDEAGYDEKKNPELWEIAARKRGVELSHTVRIDDSFNALEGMLYGNPNRRGRIIAMHNPNLSQEEQHEIRKLRDRGYIELAHSFRDIVFEGEHTTLCDGNLVKLL